MVICEEESSEESYRESKEKGAIVPMAKQCPNQTGSLLLQRKHSLSVTFLRDFQGVVLKLYQAPEIIRNFVTFLPRGSQFKLCLQLPQRNFLPRQNDSVKMLGWNNNNSHSLNRSQIIKTLREVVKRAVMEFRLSSSPLNLNERDDFNDVVEAVPVSFRPPQSTGMEMVLSQKKRVTTLLVGETLLSFELPHDCPFDPEDLDKLADEERREIISPNSNGENIYNVPRYTFLQRLDGWKMERRQRVNGRFDMYYHHLPSRRVFRSITEVVNFFMYEVYPDKPQKSATKSKLGEDDLSGKRREKKEKRVTPLKRKRDESKKPREKWHPIYDLNVDIQKAYDRPKPMIYDVDQKAHDHHHIPIFDLNDDQQKEEEDHENPKNIYDVDNDHDDQNNNPMYDDVVGDNYQEAQDHKETVEKFLAEAYNNLINLPHAQKSTSFSFDINEEISEVEEEEEDGNFNPNNQTVEELLAEAYNNLMNYSINEPKLQKGKEKRSRSIEKPRRRKKVKTFSPTPFPSFPNTSININSIPKEKKKDKEKIITDTVVESMEVQKAASFVKHKRFNIKEVNGNVVFTDVDCEPSSAVTTTTTLGGGGGSSSAMEVAKSVAFLHMDECDLINHIPESSDMFDLAMFLANNRGNGGF